MSNNFKLTHGSFKGHPTMSISASYPTDIKGGREVRETFVKNEVWKVLADNWDQIIAHREEIFAFVVSLRGGKPASKKTEAEPAPQPAPAKASEIDIAAIIALEIAKQLGAAAAPAAKTKATKAKSGKRAK